MVGIQGSDVISEELALAYSAHQPSMNVCGNGSILIDPAVVKLDFERPGCGVVPNGPDRARRDRDSDHGFPFGRNGLVELRILCSLGKPPVEQSVAHSFLPSRQAMPGFVGRRVSTPRRPAFF